MTFSENFKRICNERGTSPTAVVKRLKGSSSFVTAINHGSLPKEGEMIQMAEILDCSVLDFFADDEEIALREAPQSEDERDLLRIYRALPRRAKHEFMAMVYDFEARVELEGDKGAAVAQTNRPY